MKYKLLTLSLVTALVVPTAYAQQGGGSTNANSGQTGAHLPPGLQNRQQLPPGLQNRDQLPPGLQNRQGQIDKSQSQNQSQGIPLRNQYESRGIGLTNPYVNRELTAPNQVGGARIDAGSQAGGARIGLTNQFGVTQTNVTGVTPTSRPGANQRVYGTNTSRINVTNNLQVQYEDEAVSPADERLLIQSRRAVQPIIARISGATPRVTSEGTAWSPVHFHIRDNVITLVGYVPTPVVKQQIVATVQQLPGVARVVDQLEIREVSSTGAEVQDQGTAGEATVEDTDTITGAGSSITLSNRFSLSGTNEVGGSTNLAPTSNLTNQSRLYPGTNRPGTNGTTTNLPPTGRDSDRNYGTNRTNNLQGLPPGLQKRDDLPPGLEKRQQLPPGLQKRQSTTNL